MARVAARGVDPARRAGRVGAQRRPRRSPPRPARSRSARAVGAQRGDRRRRRRRAGGVESSIWPPGSRVTRLPDGQRPAARSARARDLGPARAAARGRRGRRGGTPARARPGRRPSVEQGALGDVPAGGLDGAPGVGQRVCRRRRRRPVGRRVQRAREHAVIGGDAERSSAPSRSGPVVPGSRPTAGRCGGGRRVAAVGSARETVLVDQRQDNHTAPTQPRSSHRRRGRPPRGQRPVTCVPEPRRGARGRRR